jgi:hypothetical protein
MPCHARAEGSAPKSAILLVGALTWVVFSPHSAAAAASQATLIPFNLAIPTEYARASGADERDFKVAQSQWLPRPAIELEVVHEDAGGCSAALDPMALRDSRTLLLCGAEEVTGGIKLKSEELATRFGTLQFYGAMGKLATVDTRTIYGLLGSQQFSQENTAVTYGLRDSLFDGRLVISSDFAHSRQRLSWDANDEAYWEQNSGNARWHRFEARVVEMPELRWLLTGEINSVDDGYAANPAAGVARGNFGIRGRRQRLYTSVTLWDVTFSASSDDRDSSHLDRKVDRANIDLGGIDLGLSAKRITRHWPISERSIRSESNLLTLELMPEVLLPDAVGQLGDVAALLPNLISLEWQQGWQGDLGPIRNEHDVSSFEALFDWSGRLGNTTALYWREDRVPSGTFPDSEIGFDQLVDIGHTVKIGGWRLGAGISLFNSSLQSSADGYSDASASGNFTLVYAATDGPEFRLRLGRSQSEFELEDDLAREEFSSNAMNLSTSLDLTQFIRKQLDRPDLSLKAEYRRYLNESASTSSKTKEREREAFLLLFRASL